MEERSVPAPVDRYEVLEFLAEGGMGAIYLGKKRGAGGFEKEVVLKQLRPEYTEQPEFIELFLREARLSAALDHANIVHTIDLVRAGSDYFMVMEYVRGGDLRILMKRAKKRKKRIVPSAALFIAREVLAALVYAHNRVGPDGKPLGLIHRDVSPSNILLSGAGEIKLTDFGIAKATTHHSTFYRVRGKIGYMSPEQAKSQALEPRSDVYSVAVILWEMLTAEKLHVAASLTTSADDMYAQPVAPVSQKVPGLVRELDWVLAKGLAVDPRARYQSAGEFMEDLLRVAAKNDLMFSALALSRHLVEVCGPVEEWGSTTIRETGTSVSEAREPGGTEKLPDVDFDAQVEVALQDDEAAEAEPEEDLVWVDKLDEPVQKALPRARAQTNREEPQRLAAVNLSPVEEFISARVSSIEPSVVRPRRRMPSLVIATVVALALVSMAIVVGMGGLERAPAPAQAPPPAPKPVPPPKPVKLVVESDPPRSRVLVDGQVRCATPCTLDATAPPAATLLTVDREGYLPWTELVVPTADTLKVKLRREPPRASSGQVIFKNGPPANVQIGGKSIGYVTSPTDPLVLPAGEQVLEVLLPKPTEIKVVVKAGQTTEVDLREP
jgi:serine/threonine protein kinase